MQKTMYGYNMPTTLERHFENLAQSYSEVQEVYSLWSLLKRRIAEQLVHSSGVFANYSLHDKSHSLSVIQSVERLLGEERICKLSVTDTFMLLVCIYAHDYGMAQTFNKVYDILGSARFKKFIEEKEKDRQSMEVEDEWAIHNLFQYLNEKKADLSLSDLYFSIMLVIQLYLRPMHWQGVIDIKSDYDGLFQGHLKKRFIYGSEGIVEICMCHGQSIEDLKKLSYCADGMIGDEYHPRFVAAMLRLGDLLDIDNGRFPMWFVRAIAQNKSVIPRLSVLHFRKHESVSHLLITPDKIEITAHCFTMQPERGAVVQSRQEREFQEEKAQKESYEVAGIVSDWTEQLAKECRDMSLNWKEIAQPDFGLPPSAPEVKIYVDGKEYMAENKALQMKMSQERVMKLLEGTSIYKDRYVGIREMIQNAIDASLLQLWNDLMHNHYISCGLSRENVLRGFDLFDLLNTEKAAIFGNYDITVEVIEDKLRGQVIVVVKDKGIGINTKDVQYMADIGSSKEKNVRLRKLMDRMPAWLKPSGVFGIGLQSVFQLTDCIEFYTRQYNQPEWQISIYSYGRNQGKIETKIVSGYDDDKLYFDNAIPGTNVKIVIEPRKFFDVDKKRNKSNFIYYDPEFDAGEELHTIFEEISQVCEKKISEVEYDYFNICYDVIIIEKDGRKKVFTQKDGERTENIQKDEFDQKSRNYLRRSYIYPKDSSGAFDEKLLSFDIAKTQQPKVAHDSSYVFSDDMAFFWDRENSRCYKLTLRPCTKKKAGEKDQVALPQKIQSVYEISYKFNKISNTEAIYAQRDPSGHLHAGFLKLEVLILDDKPMNYMNIDRDRLKEGAVDEDELLIIRKEMVKRWCRYLCEETGPGIKSMEERYGNRQEILISLILTFYRNVSAEDFNKFIHLWKDLDRLCKVCLEGEEISVSELWNVDNVFRTSIILLEEFGNSGKKNEKSAAGNSGKKDEENDTVNHDEKDEKNDAQEACENETKELKEIRVDNICRLPHRLVNIVKLQKEGNALQYDLQLQAFDKKQYLIEMNEGARLHDYLFALDLSRTEKKYDFASLKGKVFKPDKCYENLVVPCFPHTFHKGRNMEQELDYCIEWYILSPFDKLSTDILEQDLIKMKAKAEAKAEVKAKAKAEAKEWSKELKKALMEGEQIEKCVSYIMDKRFRDSENKTLKEQEIKQEYEQFLRNFYDVVAEEWLEGEFFKVI